MFFNRYGSAMKARAADTAAFPYPQRPVAQLPDCDIYGVELAADIGDVLAVNEVPTLPRSVRHAVLLLVQRGPEAKAGVAERLDLEAPLRIMSVIEQHRD
jgi:hypothetical protein